MVDTDALNTHRCTLARCCNQIEYEPNGLDWTGMTDGYPEKCIDVFYPTRYVLDLYATAAMQVVDK